MSMIDHMVLQKMSILVVLGRSNLCTDPQDIWDIPLLFIRVLKVLIHNKISNRSLIFGHSPDFGIVFCCNGISATEFTVVAYIMMLAFITPQ